jgi:hypothetical protein
MLAGIDAGAQQLAREVLIRMGANVQAMSAALLKNIKG